MQRVSVGRLIFSWSPQKRLNGIHKFIELLKGAYTGLGVFASLWELIFIPPGK